MRFEWDDNKAESNAVKHGITFEEAVTVFADPDLLFTQDTQHSQGEEREWAMGVTESGLLVVVVFTIRGEQIRIISARIATKKEQQSYESGI
ncbi:BrnT family toxin [Chamaesiphon sp.]|uniref:BrnT family toxin n=1 Tax=Chamaesiphon sp. TaxID=2814140 RepID=UPI0035947E12